MLWCSNPDCPHRSRTGKAAEYRGAITRCADCGGALVENDPIPRVPAAPVPRALRIRLLLTIGVLSFLWLASLIPQPFINTESLRTVTSHMFGWDFSQRVGPFSLGIRPFLLAFILVELFALAVPPFRRRRHGDPAFRNRLWSAALLLGVALGLFQGYGIAVYLESLDFAGGGFAVPLVPTPGWGFRLELALTLAAGSCVFVAAANLITRLGVGSGFAVVLLGQMLLGLPGWIFHAWDMVAGEVVSSAAMVVSIAVICGLFFGAWRLLALHDRKPQHLPLRLPTCGTFPLELAAALTILPITLSNWFYSSWLLDLGNTLVPGSMTFLITELVLVAVFVPLASGMFYWRRRQSFGLPENRALWLRARLQSGGFLILVVLVWYALARWASVYPEMFPSSLMVLSVTAIAADIWAEVRARRQAPAGTELVPLASFQDVAEAIEARDALPKDRGAVIQGLHYRSLAYFFGPFVPLTILSPIIELRTKSPSSDQVR